MARELADNVVQLHAYLYPEAAYAYHLPEEIKRISEDIAWMSDVKNRYSSFIEDRRKHSEDTSNSSISKRTSRGAKKRSARRFVFLSKMRTR